MQSQVSATVDRAAEATRRIEAAGEAFDERYTAQTKLVDDQGSFYTKQIDALGRDKGSLGASLVRLDERLERANKRVDDLNVNVETLARIRHDFDAEIAAAGESRLRFEKEWENTTLERAKELAEAREQVKIANALLGSVVQQLAANKNGLLGGMSIGRGKSDTVPNADSLRLAFVRETDGGGIVVGYAFRGTRLKESEWPTLTLMGPGASAQIPGSAIAIVLLTVRDDKNARAIDVLCSANKT
ncbi:MAG TPA: hypothetical protein VGC73_03855 [Pyrinomonadaceae bacterium]